MAPPGMEASQERPQVSVGFQPMAPAPQGSNYPGSMPRQDGMPSFVPGCPLREQVPANSHTSFLYPQVQAPPAAQYAAPEWPLRFDQHMGTQLYPTPTGHQPSPFPAMQHLGVSPFGVPHPTVFIRGTPATTLLAPPVTEEHKAEFQTLRGTSRWEHLCITLNRYVSSKLVTAYTGKHGASEHANWVNSLMGYFETMGIENTAVQAQLAVLTFQETAAAWWRSHRHHTPRFVFSFPQIVEWVRTELVPEAEPSRSVLAWQRLRFDGNVNNFLQSVRSLFVTNPLPLLTALTMVSDQFGPRSSSPNPSCPCASWHGRHLHHSMGGHYQGVRLLQGYFPLEA